MHVIKLQRTDVFSVTQRIIMFAEGWFDLIPEKSGIDCIFFVRMACQSSLLVTCLTSSVVTSRLVHLHSIVAGLI